MTLAHLRQFLAREIVEIKAANHLVVIGRQIKFAGEVVTDKAQAVPHPIGDLIEERGLLRPKAPRAIVLLLGVLVDDEDRVARAAGC